VLEVAEMDSATCVPGLPLAIACVANWHGDTLPLVATRLLLAEGAGPAESAQVRPAAADEQGTSILREQVLVVSDRADEPARLGMPVDRVIGLVDGGQRPPRGHGLVVERRPVEGRVVSVLDPRRLVSRAEQIIEGTVAEAGGPQRGGTAWPEF